MLPSFDSTVKHYSLASVAPPFLLLTSSGNVNAIWLAIATQTIRSLHFSSPCGIWSAAINVEGAVHTSDWTSCRPAWINLPVENTAKVWGAMEPGGREDNETLNSRESVRVGNQLYMGGQRWGYLVDEGRGWKETNLSPGRSSWGRAFGVLRHMSAKNAIAGRPTLSPGFSPRSSYPTRTPSLVSIFIFAESHHSKDLQAPKSKPPSPSSRPALSSRRSVTVVSKADLMYSRNVSLGGIRESLAMAECVRSGMRAA